MVRARAAPSRTAAGRKGARRQEGRRRLSCTVGPSAKPAQGQGKMPESKLSQVVFRPLCPLCGEGAEEPAEAVLGPGGAWYRPQDVTPGPPDYTSSARAET